VGDRGHRWLGAGLTRFLSAHHEQVVELDRPKRTARRHGAKSDPIDATRAAREALGRDRLAQPRAAGQRAALAVRLVSSCARLRQRSDWDLETAATAASLRALARRIQLLEAETADHTRAITTLVRAWRPDLLTRCGVARSWPPSCCVPGPMSPASSTGSWRPTSGFDPT
jgi:transposase